VNLNLRLPPDVHARVKEAAAKETRSLNGQIVQMLRDALKLRDQGTPTTD